VTHRVQKTNFLSYILNFLTPHHGAGGVLFANNMAGLAYSLNRPIYSVDWTGFGASTRLDYHGSSTKDALNYFIKPFEDWRKQNNIEKMDLVGHSLGGYLAGKYCLNYNGENTVDNLILASPVGIPHMPAPDPDKKIPIVFKTVRKLWSMGATMSGFIRLLGHYPGHALMGWAAKKRFDGGQTLGLDGDFVSEKDQQLCVDYLHQLFAAKGEGEAAAAKHLLQPGAYAFEPLIDEVSGFKSSNVMFIYGDRDWMSIRAGADAASKIDGKLRTDVVQIEGTHHLYLDSPDQFNNAVVKFLNK